MSGRNSTGRLAGWLADVRLDVVGAVVGLLGALGLFPLRFLSSQIYIRTLPVVLGAACVLYLFAVRQTRDAYGVPQLGGDFARLAPTVVFLGMAAMVALAAVTGQRSLHFYDVGGVVGTVLLAQVFLLDEDDFYPGVVLAQIVVFAFVVRFAALYTAPGFIGIDVWSHITYIESILRANALSAMSGSKYIASPFFHLLTIAAAGFYDLSIRNGLYLSLGIAMPLSILLVYETAGLLVSARWAVLAAAVYAVGDHTIRWGIHLIPTSMGLVFFLAVLFALVRFLQHDTRRRDTALLIGFSAAVILTHQISSFIMLVLIGTGIVGQILLKVDVIREADSPYPFAQTVKEPANLLGLMVFDLGLITLMWSMTPYQGDTFLETVLSYLYVTIVSSAGFLSGVTSETASSASAGGAAAANGSQFITQLSTYLDTVGFLLLLCTTVVGSLVVLRRRRANHATFTLLISVVAMLFFVLGLPLFGIENFVPGRWWAFLYAPMAVLTAVGIRFVARNLSPAVVVICLVVFVMAFPSVMLMSSDGTPDSPVFPSQNERLAYTDTELTAVRTLGDVTEGRSAPLYTDHPYITVFDRTNANDAEPIQLRNGRSNETRMTVYREYQSDGGSFFRTPAGAGIRNPPRSAICPASADHVYANGDVRVCAPQG